MKSKENGGRLPVDSPRTRCALGTAGPGSHTKIWVWGCARLQVEDAEHLSEVTDAGNGASQAPPTWAGTPISFLFWLNFGYLFYRRNSCVYSRIFHVTSQYVLRRCPHWLALRTKDQLIVQEEKLCFLARFGKVLITISNQYNNWLNYPLSLFLWILFL